MRRYSALGVLAITGLMVALAAPRAGGQAADAPTTAPAQRSPIDNLGDAAQRMASVSRQASGYPELGTEVEVGLSRRGESSVPKGFARSDATLVGRLIAFDADWVGLEADDGARLWLPRENLAYVLTEARGGIRRGPMHQKPSE